MKALLSSASFGFFFVFGFFCWSCNIQTHLLQVATTHAMAIHPSSSSPPSPSQNAKKNYKKKKKKEKCYKAPIILCFLLNSNSNNSISLILLPTTLQPIGASTTAAALPVPGILKMLTPNSRTI